MSSSWFSTFSSIHPAGHGRTASCSAFSVSLLPSSTRRCCYETGASSVDQIPALRGARLMSREVAQPGRAMRA